MVVLDRTGSMCQKSNGADDHPQCTDMGFAKTGIGTFLGFMDPDLDHVGFAVFPPAYNQANSVCVTPTNSSSALRVRHVLAVLGHGAGRADARNLQDAIRWQTTTSSRSGGSWELEFRLVADPDASTASSPAGTTSYVNSIEEAQHELDDHGRGNVQDVIVFLSDGAANTTPRWISSYMEPWRTRPCAAGVEAARRVKDSGTIIYTIGYDLNGLGTDYEQCRLRPSGCSSKERASPRTTRSGRSRREPDNFYNKPDPGQLNTIFTRIAADLQRPAARLIDDGLQ